MRTSWISFGRRTPAGACMPGSGGANSSLARSLEHDIADWSLQCRSGIARLDRRSVAAGGSPYRAACAAANRPGFV
jgi:hypothetical protein